MGTILSKYAAASAHFLCGAEKDVGAGSKRSNAAADGDKNVKRGPKGLLEGKNQPLGTSDQSVSHLLPVEKGPSSSSSSDRQSGMSGQPAKHLAFQLDMATTDTTLNNPRNHDHTESKDKGDDAYTLMDTKQGDDGPQSTDQKLQNKLKLSQSDAFVCGTYNDIGHDQFNNCSITNVTAAEDADEERRKIADWLSPLNFKAKQNDVFQSRQDGTGDWLLESKEFKDWVSGEAQTLWCYGIPGAGKTVLSSIVVDYLRKQFKNDTNVAVLCVYCNYNERVEQTAPNLVASLLKQLVQDKPSISSSVRSLYDDHNVPRTRPTLDELRNVLKQELAPYSKVYIVVDGLDECPEVNGIRARLMGAVSSLSSTVNLMVTSRNIASIEKTFQGTKRLEIYANDQDIRKYIEGRIPLEPWLAIYVEQDETLREKIVKTIIESVRGMFLLARLHMNMLAIETSIAKIRRALQTLPKEMDASYDVTMKRIEGQSEDCRTMATRTFSWLTYSRRALYLKELQYVLAVSQTASELGPDDLIDERILTSICAGLVVVDRESGIVRLVHYTTQQYFERMQETRIPNAQNEITTTCLTYLSFDAFSQGPCQSEKDLESMVQHNALFDYSARYWVDHARGQVEEDCKAAIQKFLRDDSKVACASQLPLLDLKYYCWYNSDIPRHFSGVHLASFFGLQRTLGYLLSENAKADVKDNIGRTALSAAAENGQEEIVRLLVERDDVDVNSPDQNGLTPLSLALVYEREAVVNLLLEHADVDINSEHCVGPPPLWMMVARRQEPMVKLLLKRADVDVNASPRGSDDDSSKSPLWLAVACREEGIVRLLLTRDDVDMNTKDAEGKTALWTAVACRQEGIVRLLLTKEKVELNTKDVEGHTPLWMAVACREEGIVNLLTEKGADITDDVLELAGNIRNEKIMQSLIARLLLKEDVD